MKKIMFNDKYGLTQAVIDGRKTQTRRIVPNIKSVRQSPFVPSGYEDEHGYELKPKYKVGEIVAVAQKYSDVLAEFPSYCQVKCYRGSSGYANKMFVIADLMPYQIRITGVRIERLQDISDGDCIKEGIEWAHAARKYYVGYNPPTGPRTWLRDTARDSYADLIDRINGKGTWDSNPWVWVYEFELIK